MTGSKSYHAYESNSKRNVWRHLFQLIIPYKKRFTIVVVIGLLGTDWRKLTFSSFFIFKKNPCIPMNGLPR